MAYLVSTGQIEIPSDPAFYVMLVVVGGIAAVVSTFFGKDK